MPFQLFPLALAWAALSIPLLAGENVIKNGSFDEGAAFADGWEHPDGLTSFFETEEGRGRIVKMDTLVDRDQALECNDKVLDTAGRVEKFKASKAAGTKKTAK